MKLHELSPVPGSNPKAYRKGRGNGSGNGKTAGRGQKGQWARSGGGVRGLLLDPLDQRRVSGLGGGGQPGGPLPGGPPAGVAVEAGGDLDQLRGPGFGFGKVAARLEKQRPERREHLLLAREIEFAAVGQQRNLLAAAAGGRQQRSRVAGGQDQQSLRRRLLQRFEQRVLGFVVHPVGVVDHADLAVSAAGAGQMELLLEIAQRIRLRLAPFADLDEVHLSDRAERVKFGIGPLLQLTADPTARAGAPFPAVGTRRDLRQHDRELPAGALRIGVNQKGVGEAVMLPGVFEMADQRGVVEGVIIV